MGIIEFMRDGRYPTQQEMEENDKERRKNGTRHIRRIPVGSMKTTSVSQKIRDGLEVKVQTSRKKLSRVSAMDIARTHSIIDEYTGSVFTPHVGLIKTNSVKFGSQIQTHSAAPPPNTPQLQIQGVSPGGGGHHRRGPKTGT